MRFETRAVDDRDLRAAYGWDPALGYFVEVRRNRRLMASHDSTVGGDNSMRALLMVMKNQGFFDEDDIQQARSWLKMFEVEDILDPRTRLAAEVVENIKQAVR